MKLQRRITTRECPAPRPSVVCDRALGDDATIGVNANLALDPGVSDFDNPADASNSVRSSLAGLRRIQPLGVGYGLDESERMVGVGIAVARDLLSEMALYRRQGVAVLLLGFGDHLCSCVRGHSISLVTSGLRPSRETCLAQLSVRISRRVDNKLIGGPTGAWDQVYR